MARKFPKMSKPPLPITVRQCEDKQEYQRQWRKLNPDWWIKRYGLTIKDYDNLLDKQKGFCAICSTQEPGGKNNKFHIDHDHKTGKVRGLLCHNCNRGLGFFKDSSFLLSKASSYILENQREQETIISGSPLSGVSYLPFDPFELACSAGSCEI